jgi:hypothetical protein
MDCYQDYVQEQLLALQPTDPLHYKVGGASTSGRARRQPHPLSAVVLQAWPLVHSWPCMHLLLAMLSARSAAHLC